MSLISNCFLETIKIKSCAFEKILLHILQVTDSVVPCSGRGTLWLSTGRTGSTLYQCSRTYHKILDKLAGEERGRPSMTQAILCSNAQLKKLSNTAYHNKLTNFHYCKINKATSFPKPNASGIVPLWGCAMYWAACQYIQPLGIYKQRPIRVLSTA